MPNFNNKKKKHNKKRHDKNNNNTKVNSKESSIDRTSLNEESQAENDDKSDEIINELPYLIKNSDIMGRYLITSNDLKAGEIIIEEPALVIGPCADSDPVCLGCYTELTQLNKQFKCRGCGWPLCGSDCKGIKTNLGHNTWECSILREKRVSDLLDKNDKYLIRQMYEVVLPLRCLLLKTNDKNNWEKLQVMESHNEIRRQIPKIWNRNQKIIVNMIRNIWNIKDYSEDEIHNVCGILEVNSFEIGQNGARGRALYPSAFLLAHSCLPNTTHSDHPLTHNLTVRVTKSMKKHEMLTLSYAYTLQGTLKRREHLKECKFFWCSCERCTDPTELNTFTSAMQCPKCRGGLVFSLNPLDQDAPWTCKACNYTITGKSILLIVDRIFAELDSIDTSDIEKYEEFLQKYINVLHKNHYLCLSAKHSLCQLYGRTEGYIIHELSLENLKRKEQYCRDLLEISTILEPGLSRLRGVTMYELHAPIMVQATREFELKKISCDVLKKRLKEVVKLLKDSREILSIEPEGSSEHTMALAAEDALKRLGNF